MPTHKRGHVKADRVKRTLLVLIGSVIAAVGLQFFLLPNHMIDGGVTGLSIIVSTLAHLPLGLFIVLLNIPFVILGYKKFGKSFAIYSLIGITSLACLTITHFEHGFTDIPILAAIFGGVFVGTGIGLVVRYGGTIDGTDTIAILIDKFTIFSISEAVLVINGFIITLSGFLFGWENALYSLIAYFVAHKAIDITVEGFNESRCVWIVSMHAREIGKGINDIIKEPVTYVKESDPKSREPHGVILAVISRLEEQKARATIMSIDPYAYIVFTNAHEVIGRLSEGTLYIDR